MLVAEIHGHVVPEVLGSEDYLTSSVFGHLRYLPPAIFWPEFFSLALELPIAGPAKNLTDVLLTKGIDLRLFQTLTAHFWLSHPMYGIPDLLLSFSGGGQRATVILIEAKLNAVKSGTGERDQLVRYLGLLDELKRFEGLLPRDRESVVVYLTERDSAAEVEDSIEASPNHDDARRRIFRLCWQDILIAAKQVNADGIHNLILEDIVSFLRVRGLEYFKGFSRMPLPEMRSDPGCFYSRTVLRHMPMPSAWTLQKGKWAL